MRILVFLGALFAASLPSLHARAASVHNRPYCMEIAYGGGGSTFDCSYESFEQCLRWKVDISSTCMRNPQWYGRTPQRYVPR
ncbi:MAG TPA: DUF3551 domain-containing protein [Xanthobacteraceae bacterium]|nr:DUF3551 domain-containing protein [Xanthobacteraceae bacterium]